MSTLKTTKNRRSVSGFLGKIKSSRTRNDCRTILALMKQATRSRPSMWGSSIVGFGGYHYRYESGREGEWFLTGFSPRKQHLAIYIMSGLKRHRPLLKNLGTHKTAGSCLYLKDLDDVSLPVLKRLIAVSVRDVRRRWT